MNPLVSIVITTFNRSKLLARALDSALKQTFNDLEVIVIDDGSTDNTRAMVEIYAKEDPRIKYFFQENKGVVGAKNAGIKESHGDYIAFLDSDDIWMPEKLAKQVATLKADKDIGLVYSNARIITNEGAATGKIYIKTHEKSIATDEYFQRMIIRDFIPLSSIIVRREVFSTCGLIREDFHGSDDYEWLLRLLSNGVKFSYIDEVLMEYRLTHNSDSSDLHLRHKITLRILKIYAQKLQNVSPNYTRQLKKRYAQAYYGLGYANYEKNNLKEAREALRNSILNWPFCDGKKYLLLLFCILPQNIINQLKQKRAAS